MVSSWRRMWRGRRKSGYGHTAVLEIIIGFVRQHLLCQHSSRQPGGGRAKNRLQSSERQTQRQTETRPDTGRRNPPFTSPDTLEFTLVFMWAQSLNLQPKGHKFNSPVCPAAVSLTKADSPQADHDLWPAPRFYTGYLVCSSVTARWLNEQLGTQPESHLKMLRLVIVSLQFHNICSARKHILGIQILRF